MKKNFRGGSGGKPDSSKSASNKGTSKSKSSSGSKDSQSPQGARTQGRKPQRDIKNARSLKDVLGMGGGKPTGSSERPTRGGGFSTRRDNDEERDTRSGARDQDRRQKDRRDDRREDRRENRPFGRTSDSESRGQAGGQSKGPVSKKLTYITNFTPPPEPAQQKSGRQERAERPERPQRFDRQDRPERNERSERSDRSKPSGRSERSERSERSGRSKSSEPSEQSKPSERPQRRDQPKRFDQKDKPGKFSEKQKPFQERSRKEAPETKSQNLRWPQERVTAVVSPAKQTGGKASETEARGGRRKSSVPVVQGFVKRHPDGFGFLIADDPEHPDVYVPRQSMVGVMTNDRVELELHEPRGFSKSKDDRLSGRITRILKRANTRVVGRFLHVDRKYGVILDENKGWGADLRISGDDAQDAHDGDMVAVEIIQYPGPDHEFTGRVIQVLGDMEDPINDVIRVVHEQSIPLEFSKGALEDARRYGAEVTEKDRRGREDIRDLDLITIDGATARDFDDAVHTEQTESGFKLTVAIADVSHYVKPGTALDRDAYERGTSTYFPNFVVPMLPEELSNELCSLKPNVERLCFVCEMHIDFQGVVEEYRFFEGVMRSKARVIYGEAQEVLDGRVPPKLKHVAESIKRCGDLAKILMAKRFREGSLDLEVPESQVVVDETGESVDIVRSERLFAHRLIEELMLVTNICTARFLDEAKIPGIYRVHEEPDPDSIRSLQRYLWNLGGKSSVMGGMLQKKLTQALQSMEGRPEAGILNILTLRTMQQAHYAHDNVGHFGLGFSHYSHFTSPIRRYPDLIAHRLIKSQIYPRYEGMGMSEDELASATTFLSACEQRSTKAERKVVSIKKARFMRRFLEQDFDGIISSVTKFGVFVLLRQYDVDGLVKIEFLGPDRWQFDDENLRLIGSRTGFRYTIGDAVRVKVTGVRPEEGRIDFELAELPEELEARTGRRGGAEDETDDELGDLDLFDSDGRREPQKRGPGGSKAKEPKGGAFKSGSKNGKKNRSNSQKRSAPANDRGGVRKERVSKRRGKN